MSAFLGLLELADDHLHLIAALIAVAAITALQSLGNELSTTFNNVKTELTEANKANQ